MKITICGSMTFYKEMKDIKTKLEKVGHSVYVPKSIDLIDKSGYKIPLNDRERVKHKIAYDFIREHFRKIDQAEGILVLNYDKKGVKNYVGGNTFLEMGYAFGRNKKLFLLHPIPRMDYSTEMRAMQPVILRGDLGKIE